MTDISEINGIKYFIKNKNDIIQKTLLNRMQWNNHILLLIAQFLKKYKLKHFLNIGCHIGTIALPISKYIDKVTAIEAYPPTYEHLNENLKLNNIKNIETLNYAIGDKDQKIYFLDESNIRIKNNTGGMHVITNEDIKNNRLSSKIYSKKLNNYMKKLDDIVIDKFDLLLADVEGKEYEMLLGGEKKILEYKPIIIVEIWGNKKRKLENMSTSSEKIIDHIIKLKYKLYNKFGDNYIFLPEDF
tara:strand:- start:6934 stop:7662 length:729 start_codon:yes stop_codon:yes gene_type:complete